MTRGTSIGLNWLRRINRHLPTPSLHEYDPSPDCNSAGFYAEPYPKDVEHRGIIIPASRNGTLVVFNWEHLNWTVAPTIAHEWRHHWQYWHGIKFEISALRGADEEYPQHIVRYFTTSRTEYDALRFEATVTNSPEVKWRWAAVKQYQRSKTFLEWNG